MPATIKHSMVLAVWLMVTGCTPSEVTIRELQAYIENEDNGLIRQYEGEAGRIVLRYRPTEIVARAEIQANITNVDSILNHYNHYLYFTVSFSKNGKPYDVAHINDHPQYGKIKQYFNSGISGTVDLRSSGSKKKLLDFVYLDTFGSTTSNEVLLVFEREELKADLVFTINALEIGLVERTFEVKMNDINKIPRVKF